MSETATTRIPVQAAPAPSRWARLRGRVGSMSPRARWLNLGLLVLLIVAVVLAFMLIGKPITPTAAHRRGRPRRDGGAGASDGTGATGGTASTPVAVGIVKSVSGTTLTLTNFGGTVVTVTVPTTATVTTDGLGGLTAGETVSVAGTEAADGRLTATSVVGHRSGG
jgi:hypothetical protein